MIMANFAKAQLLKYGWTEGKGLGKNENGMTEALKPKLKFDTMGVGHKVTDTNQWWETAFNKAANNIAVEAQSNGVSISIVENDKTEISPKKVLKTKKDKYQSDYGNFLKTSTLTNGHLVHENGFDKEEPEVPTNSTTLTDEELFLACGGRTAHKGARHGLTLNGKLERIAQQEKKLLGITNDSNSFSTISFMEKYTREKSKKESEDSQDEYEMDNNANTILPEELPSTESAETFRSTKKARKKERKQMHILSHRLSIACKINESDKCNTTDENILEKKKKKSNLKRKRSKERKSDSTSTALTDTTTTEDQELDQEICAIPLPKEPEKRKMKKKKLRPLKTMQESDKHFLEHSINKKKKCKRKRNQGVRDITDTMHMEDDDVFISLPKKVKKSHKKSEDQADREKNKYTTNRFDILNPLQDEAENSSMKSEKHKELQVSFTAKEAKRLNYHIKKKKKARAYKKQMKLEKLAKNLMAVSVSSKKESKSGDVSAEKKLDTIVKDLMAVNLTENVTASIKKSGKKNKKGKKLS